MKDLENEIAELEHECDQSLHRMQAINKRTIRSSQRTKDESVSVATKHSKVQSAHIKSSISAQTLAANSNNLDDVDDIDVPSPVEDVQMERNIDDDNDAINTDSDNDNQQNDRKTDKGRLVREQSDCITNLEAREKLLYLSRSSDSSSSSASSNKCCSTNKLHFSGDEHTKFDERYITLKVEPCDNKCGVDNDEDKNEMDISNQDLVVSQLVDMAESYSQITDPVPSSRQETNSSSTVSNSIKQINRLLTSTDKLCSDSSASENDVESPSSSTSPRRNSCKDEIYKSLKDDSDCEKDSNDVSTRKNLPTAHISSSDESDEQDKSTAKSAKSNTKEINRLLACANKLCSDSSTSENDAESSSSSLTKVRRKSSKNKIHTPDGDTSNCTKNSNELMTKINRRHRPTVLNSSSDESDKPTRSTTKPTNKTAASNNVNQKVRRRRLRKPVSDVEEDEDDQLKSERLKDAGEQTELAFDESDQGDQKGRRKIRKILTSKRISETTKAAEADEQERRRRLLDRQKSYNQYLLQEGEGINAVATKLILEHGDPPIEIHPEILKHLKPHQVEAVRFLWDCTMESVECVKKLNSSNDATNSTVGHGAILAHCMGLGKTLSVITFIHTLLRYPEQLNINRGMIICPVNTLLNWKHEWEMWSPEDEPVDVFEFSAKSPIRLKIDILKHWYRKGGVLLVGYDMFRNFVTSLMKRTRSKDVRNTLNTSLLNPGPDIVICDEGHLLKNAKSHLAIAVSQIRTTRRIILTGTPLQNNLNEYHAMVNFVKPNLLGTLREFNNRFVNPIKNGQHSNSTPRDVNIMKKRAHILYKTLDGCVQRKDYSVLTKYLPPRYEYVIMCRLTSVQCELYSTFLTKHSDYIVNDRISERGDEARGKASLFAAQQTLYRIATHPRALRIHETKEARKMLLLDNDSFIDDEDEIDLCDDSSESDSSKSLVCLGSSDGDNGNSGSDDDVKSISSNQAAKNTSGTVRRSTRGKRPLTRQESKNHALQYYSEGSDTNEPETSDLDSLHKPWWYNFYKDEYDWRIDVGAKINVLFNIIQRCSNIGDKVILFTHSLISLDLIEVFLAELHRQWSVLNGEIIETVNTDQSLGGRPDLSDYFSDIGYNTWLRGFDYERMDGSMNVNTRKDLQTRFNSTSNTRLRLFIISTRAGGLGINLIAANRLILLDASWNPSHDIQSIFRSYRFGQTKPVYIYRLIAHATIEEKIYDRQVTKQSLSLRVIDEQQIDRHFSDVDLQALFTFEPDIEDPNIAHKRPTPILPKDRLLADLITEQPHLIVTYHNHDSLLEHREDEGLTESERQEAWHEFEEEKRLGISLAQHQRMLMQQEFLLQHQQQQLQRLNVPSFSTVFNRVTNLSDGVLLDENINNSPKPCFINTTQNPNITANNNNNIIYNNNNINMRFAPQTNNPNPVGYMNVASNNITNPRLQQPARFAGVQAQSLPGRPYSVLYEEVRQRLLLSDPRLAANPARLERAAMNRLLSSFTTPVLVNSANNTAQPVTMTTGPTNPDDSNLLRPSAFVQAAVAPQTPSHPSI